MFNKGIISEKHRYDIFSMYGVTKDAHSSFPFHISTGLSKVEPEIDISNVQGLFVPFAHVGSGDPVRVLRLFHNEYTGYD